MAWKSSVLVVANVTATSDELLGALLERTSRAAASFRLLIPVSDASPPALEAAEATLATALGRMRDAGLEVTGKVGDSDPVLAVQAEFDPRRYDEIVVSTLPSGASKWLQIDLPHRIERATAAPVSHVVSQPPVQIATVTAVATHEPQGVLTPLRVLSWGGGHRR
jgi:hypothetical protein